MGRSEGAPTMGNCVSVSRAGRMISPPGIVKKSSKKKAGPVFRIGNPCLKIFDDVSQGLQVGVP